MRTSRYHREELVGNTIEMLMPKRYRRRHTSHRAGYFLHPAVRPMGQSPELYGLREDGTEFPVEISLSPMVTSMAARFSCFKIANTTNR